MKRLHVASGAKISASRKQNKRTFFAEAKPDFAGEFYRIRVQRYGKSIS
jgi:hypothetical protein